MNEMIKEFLFFGAAVSIMGYELGLFLKAKFRLPIFNPLLISIIAVMIFLSVFHIDYESYNVSARYLSYLLTPATVCLAVPLYQQLSLLKKHARAILAGTVTGVLTTMATVLVLALLFQLTHEQYVTFLPKSITTAIGMGDQRRWAALSRLPWPASSLRGSSATSSRRPSAVFSTSQSQLQRGSPSVLHPTPSAPQKPWKWARSKEP